MDLKLYMKPDEPVGGPAVTEPAAPDTPAVQEPAPGPWSDDLARAFPDEGQRGQVDQFLRSTVQPYITQKEQELGHVADIWDSLWNEDETYPTYLELAGALYGDDVARKLAQTLAEHFEAEGATPEEAAAAAVQAVGDHAAADAPDNVPAVPEFDAWLQTVPQEFRQFVTSQMESQEDATYEEQLDALQVSEPTIGANRELFSRYVAASEGDYGLAVDLWNREMAPVLQANPTLFGEDTDYAKFRASETAAATTATTPARQAPTVLGGASTAGGTTPPQIPSHQSLDEAITDFLVDVKQNGGGGL